MKSLMAQRKTLTERQIEVLRWIAYGCAPGVVDGTHHRISAAALRNRGLVQTRGRGATWTATVTNAGRRYLAEVDGPKPPTPRQAKVSVTQQLVEDIVGAGGSLRVPRMGWNRDATVDYEHRARLAERFGKVPDGKRLVVRTVERELELVLVDDPDRVYARKELCTIVVPERVARLHVLARRFRDSTVDHEVSREQLRRAVRIFHVVASEAEQRGWQVVAPEDAADVGASRSRPRREHMRIVASGFEFAVRLQEEGVRTRGPWEEAARYYRNVSPDSWFHRDRELPRGAYDAEATGRLKLELDGARPYRGRQSRWADRKAWTLEERLAHVFREIEERTVELERVNEERRLAQEKAAEEARREAEMRERDWHVLMEEAHLSFARSIRASHLRSQASDWQKTQLLRAYCAAMEAAHGENPSTAAWLEWARTYADALDPLASPPAMPEVPEPSPEQLEPFLPAGWSPLGPDARDLRQIRSRS
jgi:hypothetical protein